MVDVTYFNMLLNIGLLVLIAALLTNLEFVRTLFLEEQSSIFSKTALAVIFGIISIVSTYTGTYTDGAIINTRVIGVLAAGLFRRTLCGDVNSTDRRYSSISV